MDLSTGATDDAVHAGWSAHHGSVDSLFKLPDINGPFRGSHALADGWLTAKQLRSGLLRRLFRDVYVPSKAEVNHAALSRAASLIAPPRAVLTGLSAAALRGLDLTGPGDPVECIVPPTVRFTAQHGLNVRRLSLDPTDYESWEGIWVATPVRLTIDLLANRRLRRSLPRAVGLLDAVLRSGLVAEDQLAAELTERHDHGIVRAREALMLADPRAESVPESEVRTWLALHGIPPQVQVNVYDGYGRFLGRLDLAYLAYKVAVEYDGKWHAEGEQPELDELRRARLRAAAQFVVVTKDQLYDDPHAMVQAVRAALRGREGKMYP